MPKPKVTMWYFCIISKTGGATPIIINYIMIIHQTNLSIFIDFLQTIQVENMGINHPPCSPFVLQAKFQLNLL